MKDIDYAPATEFLAKFFGPTTTEAVEIRALPNESGASTARPLFTRNPSLVLAHCVRWDDIDRAVYFGVATRIGGIARGDRTNLAELPAIWVDIDCYKLGITKEEATDALLSLSIPPGVIVDSGGGIHAYWLLLEAIDVSQADASRWPATELAVVSVLKQLAGVFSGDLAVCDLARILRLPGTHNTKTGALRPCAVLECSTWSRCEFGDLVDMLDTQRPLIVAPLSNGHAEGHVTNEDPFIAASRLLTFKPSVDVEGRLSAMTYLGSGDNGIHATQLSVSASLVAQGVEPDEIASLLLSATQSAAGPLAFNWNWTREEASIRGMIASAVPKFAPETRASSRSSATVIELRTGGAKTAADATVAPEPAAKDDLPVIRLGGGWLAANIDEAEEALVAHRPRLPIFQYGDLLVRVAPGPIVVAIGHVAHQVLGYRAIEIGPMALRDDLSRFVDFQKWDARSKRWISTNCPGEIAEGVIARQGRWKFPALRSIIAAPAIRPDNSLVDAPGYDEATGLFYAPAGIVIPPMPIAPTRADALAAVEVLKYPLRDMPFVDRASLSVALSAVLTGLERPMMSVAPIHAFDAPQAGSGKGLICNYCACIAIGHEAGAVLASDDPAETDKTLGAKIIAGHSIILLDNVTHVLRSALLAQITSEPIVEPRILGRSLTVAVQNTVSILINGNNLVLSGDLPRRALKCRLDARVTRPELRVFASENPVAVAKRDRGRLVAAGLTILLAYRLAGMPRSGGVPIGTFDEWDARVRGALLWLGEADPVETQEHIRAVDKDIEVHENLMAAWHEAIQVGVTTSRLADMAVEMHTPADDAFATPRRRYEDLFDALAEVALSRGAGDKIDHAKLGYYLRQRVDQTVGGMRIERVGKSRTNQALWAVAIIDTGA